MNPLSGTRFRLRQQAAHMAMAALVTLLGLPVHAATTSFPQTPLITGGAKIPPNILLILDDSGSMMSLAMPAEIREKDVTSDNNNDTGNKPYTDFNSQCEQQGSGTYFRNWGFCDTPRDLSYVNNVIYYNPQKKYLPWLKHDGARFGDADFTNVIYAYKTLNESERIDLRGHKDSIFYVPKVNNPDVNNPDHWDKYRIADARVGSHPTQWNNGVIQKSVNNYNLFSDSVSVSGGGTSDCRQISVYGNFDSITINVTATGNVNVNLFVYGDANCAKKVYSDAPPYAYANPPVPISIKIKNNGRNSKNFNISVSATGWVDSTPNGDSAAAQASELQNFANWYQYHRTRIKVAKASISEAFANIGENYRVAFTTINTNTTDPAFPLPISTDNGLFRGKNRKDFYEYVQGVTFKMQGTPLRGALRRAGNYFTGDAPWKTSSADLALLSCRQNYAILTTDGYWNESFSDNTIGNADGDSSWPYWDTWSNTLADVAYYYWKKDLRSDLANNVRTTGSDPATWQHMVTFGVSIGMQGTLNINNPPPSPWNVNPLPSDAYGPKRIDDLWHATLNGHGAFVVANDTDSFAKALSDMLKAIESRTASGSNIASSTSKTDTATLTFVAGFTSGTWLGDLSASKFNAALTGVSSTPEWVLSKTFAAGQANASFSSRAVITGKTGTAKVFNTTNFGSDSDFAARTGQVDAVTADDNVNYIRGDQSKEVGRGGALRKRAYPFGDIVDSSPAYDATTNTVYIGANDGMLHGISAANGKVLFSYLPKGIDYAALASLSAQSYEHHYFVDGAIDVQTVSGNGNTQKSILIAALGRGGRGVFALDVSAPSSFGTSDALWDYTTQDATTNPDMGYVLGKVFIRKGNGGKTYAFVPNGIDSPNGSATLFVYELATNGAVSKTYQFTAADGPNNGLMSLGLADLNGDGTVDTVYGGDLQGNVWRWDFSGDTPPSDKLKPIQLFQAKDGSGNAQPITGGITVAREPLSGQVFIGFGTGRFISESDAPTQDDKGTTQSLYGLLDEATPISGRGALQKRTIPYSGTDADGRPLRGFENYSALPSDKKGWYIDLTPPERVVTSPSVYGTAMFVSSIIPAVGSSSCDSETGKGFLNAINLFTGTSPEASTGGYFPYAGNSGAVGDGLVGSIGITTGMPTEVNLTNGLATVGTGAFSSEDGSGNTYSQKLGSGVTGQPRRVMWREIIPQ